MVVFHSAVPYIRCALKGVDSVEVKTFFSHCEGNVRKLPKAWAPLLQAVVALSDALTLLVHPQPSSSSHSEKVLLGVSTPVVSDR